MRQLLKQNTRYPKPAMNFLKMQAIRPFSLLQNELEKHDFSDKLNVEELGLKNPEKKEHMNLMATIAHTLDLAL